MLTTEMCNEHITYASARQLFNLHFINHAQTLSIYVIVFPVSVLVLFFTCCTELDSFIDLSFQYLLHVSGIYLHLLHCTVCVFVACIFVWSLLCKFNSVLITVVVSPANVA